MARRSLTLVPLLPLLISGCGNDDDSAEIATINFGSATTEVNEDADEVRIPVLLSNALTNDLDISFDVSGDATHEVDFKIATPSPITIPAGIVETSIILEIIDDPYLEFSSPEEELNVRILGSGEGSTLGEELSHSVTIINNDQLPEGVMQIDLSWTVEEGYEANDVDLDLALAYDVVIKADLIESAEIYKEQSNLSGFETLQLVQSDPEEEYYIVVIYAEGSLDVEFQVEIKSEVIQDVIRDSFQSEDVGFAVFYGSLTKADISGSRQQPMTKHKLFMR